jgi:Secretion system C-terminal sorting domain
MKTLLFTLLFSTICFGQFTLETPDPYPYYTGKIVTRINLEHSGEKYIHLSGSSINFYNANHTFWKTVNLTVPTSTWSIEVNHVSENKINSDNLIEISYTTYSSPNIYQSKIINELGTVLLNVNNCSALLVDEQAGNPTKIISKSYPVTETNVYSVPNLLLEHTYVGSEIKSVNLEYSGIKYYNINSTNDSVSIYNSDHSFWKSIALIIPTGYSFSGINFLSEHQINSDNLIEIGYSYYINGATPAHYSDIINENGTTLLTVNNADNLKVSTIDGLPNKVIARLSTATSPDIENQIYNCPNLILEHTYAGNIDRVKLELSGEKYYDKRINGNTTFPNSPQIIIYNSDHTIWKTIDTPLSSNPPGPSIINVFVSETKFNTDNQVEVSFTISANTLDGGHYQSYILNEDSSIFFTVPESSAFYWSEIPTLQNKLIVYMHRNFGFLSIQRSTLVYHLDQNFSVNNFDINQVTIYPNPANDYLKFKTQNSAIKKAAIFDLQGKTIQEFEGENLEIIDINKIATGFYTIKLIDNSDNASTYKFLKTSN